MTDISPVARLATELRRQLDTKVDLMANTQRVSLDATSEEAAAGTSLLVDLPDGVQTYGVTHYAHAQIADHIGVPWKLYDRLHGKHPELLFHLANGLFTREPAKRMLRTLDGNVRAFLSDRYRPRDNWDLMDQVVLPELGAHAGDVTFKQCSLTDTRMYVKVVLPGFERDVRPDVGDIVRGGVIIQNSEVGAGALVIAPYTDRLVCSNGMVHTDLGQRARHVGRRIESQEEAWTLYSDSTLQLDDAAFFAKCRDTLRATLNEQIFETIVQKMRDLAEIRLPGSPVEQVQVLTNRHGFTEGESHSILSALVDGGDLSAWGYVNAVTRTARDLENADRQTELETLAGRLTADPSWARSAAREGSLA